MVEEGKESLAKTPANLRRDNRIESAFFNPEWIRRSGLGSSMAADIPKRQAIYNS